MLPWVAWGIVLAWSRAAARPWVIFLASKVAVAVMFYGYARQGATTIPVIALALALVVSRLTSSREWSSRRLILAAAAAGTLLVGAEAVRFLGEPELYIDGRLTRASDVLPPADHAQHVVAWR
jgi:glucose-6-phosphate-specific signal transduction histidine kinase